MKLRKHYQVNEIFTTIQGEGKLVGTPSTFIRLQGCLVGCSWCDTKYTWLKGGTRQTVPEILNQVKTPHVVITGGEPTLYDLDGLLHPLHELGHSTQLETSAQQWLKGSVRPFWITVSPKENLGWAIPRPYWDYIDEVKWVVDEPLLANWHVVEDTFIDIQASLGRYPYFVLMPEGCPPRQEMVDATLKILREIPMEWMSWWNYGDRIQYRIGVR